ncbi:MAG: helix-turn-helix domain-containing protein [Elusimicrobia bacterium]|nr:helix-turn-helix domain-containing protein [Elusimicrobiota bacterium]
MGETLGSYLKEVRKKKNYSLREAKERTGISEAYLWQLENGKREIPRPETLKKLADGYGEPVETLLNHAGYGLKPADEKKQLESTKTHLFRDYEKLSDDSKKELETFLGYLRGKEAKK